MAVEPSLELADGRLSFPAAGSVLAVDPPNSLIRELIDAWADAAPIGVAPPTEFLANDDEAEVVNQRTNHETTVPTLRVVARESALDEALSEFHAATRAAGLDAIDRIVLQPLSEPATNALLVGEEKAAALVDSPNGWFAVGESDPEVATTLRASHVPGEDEPTYRNRAPTRSEIYVAFRDRFDAELAREVLALVDATDELYREDACNQLVCPYLVGARHGVHHYDLRRAGEESGLASQATFSRIKVGLVEDGVIDTERVQRTVGRPRQRIVLGDERLVDAPLEAYPDIVADLRAD